jgi:hypothetical protein
MDPNFRHLPNFRQLKITALVDLYLYNLLQQHSAIIKIPIPLPEAEETPIPLTHLTLDDLTITDWDQFRGKTWHILSTLQLLARALILTLIVMAFFLLIWCIRWTCKKLNQSTIILFVK